MRMEEAGGADDIQSQVNVKVAQGSRSWIQPVNSASSEGRRRAKLKKLVSGGFRGHLAAGWAKGSRSECLMQMAASAPRCTRAASGRWSSCCNAQLRGLGVLQPLCTLELAALTSHLSADQFLVLTLWKVYMY